MGLEKGFYWGESPPKSSGIGGDAIRIGDGAVRGGALLGYGASSPESYSGSSCLDDEGSAERAASNVGGA